MNFLSMNGKLISPLDRFPALGGQRTCIEHFDSSKILEVVAQAGFMEKMQKTELGEMAPSVRTAMAAP